MLAEAINHWKADSAVTQGLRVQKVGEGINALHADQASAEVLRSEGTATSVNQKRAEDYIYAALHDFNQAVSKGMGSLRAGSGQLETTLRELQSILGNQEGIGEQLRKVAMDAQRIGLSPTPKPHKSEVFWQPEYPQNPPPNINQQHWEQFKSSAIHPDLIELNAQSISDVQVYERLLSEKLAKMGSGQYVTAQMAREMKKYEQMAEGGWWGGAGVDALSLINLKPGEKPTLSTWGCYKPDNPRIDQQKTQSKGKTEVRKYENPAGSSRVPFLPQVPDEIAERIYQKHGINPTEAERQSGFWFVVKQYSQIPITVTEGFKKDLSSLSQGEVTIGLTGTNHIYRANDSEGNKLPQRLLNEQIAVFAQSGREFRFAYDQDTKATTVRNVRRDMVRGIELLEARGCACKVVQWNPEDGKGLDDLIANQGAQAYSSAQRNAIASDRDKRTHYRTEYNTIARKVASELDNVSAERLDLEVYIRALQKGEVSDGTRFVGESDTARSLRAARRSLCQQKPKSAEHYVKAISSVAGTYKRLAERNVEDLDELMKKAVQRQAVALELEDEKVIALSNAHGKRPRTGPGL